MARCKRCYTLVEVVVSSLVVSIMLAAALQAVATSRIGLSKMGGVSRAMLYAQDLMSEILQQLYTDPDGGLGTFGLGSAENTGDRSQFDDVDDYDGWAASPLQYKDGSTVSGTARFERRVHVAWVLPDNAKQLSGVETGVKRITVEVLLDGDVTAEITALRTSGWPEEMSTAAVASKATLNSTAKTSTGK
jgi:MSHA pilin protein MshD